MEEESRYEYQKSSRGITKHIVNVLRKTEKKCRETKCESCKYSYTTDCYLIMTAVYLRRNFNIAELPKDWGRKAEEDT